MWWRLKSPPSLLLIQSFIQWCNLQLIPWTTYKCFRPRKIFPNDVVYTKNSLIKHFVWQARLVTGTARTSASCQKSGAGHNHTVYINRQPSHYNDVIMSVITSQITSVPIVCSIVDRCRSKKTSKLRVTGLCDRWPVNFPHKSPVTRKMFPSGDVFMSDDDTNQFWVDDFAVHSHTVSNSLKIIARCSSELHPSQSLQGSQHCVAPHVVPEMLSVMPQSYYHVLAATLCIRCWHPRFKEIGVDFGWVPRCVTMYYVVATL